MKAEQTRLLLAAISFFFFFLPRSNSSVVRISYSVKQDQLQPGRLAGGREPFCSPFHFFHRMKEVLRLFQAESFPTPSFTQLWSQTETLETLPNKELSMAPSLKPIRNPCSTFVLGLFQLWGDPDKMMASPSTSPPSARQPLPPYRALPAQRAQCCCFPEMLQQGCRDFPLFCHQLLVPGHVECDGCLCFSCCVLGGRERRMKWFQLWLGSEGKC